MNLREIFGANLRQYRKIQGLTLAEMAERTDLSLDMIGGIERGNTAPSFGSIEKIAKVLEVPEFVLFGTGLMARTESERGSTLQRVNRHLSKMNDETLAKAEKLLEAFST